MRAGRQPKVDASGSLLLYVLGEPRCYSSVS
jgi:hypothetical protein